MKKLFVVLALAGMVGSVSAATVTSLTGNMVIVSVKGDKEKKKDKKKKKSCCQGEGTGKACSHDGKEGGGCCKDKQKAADAPKQ